MVNKKWVPFVMGPRHLDMSEDDLKAEIKKMEPEILIIPSEAWRIVSLDEVKLELNTHDDHKRRGERSFRAGPDDDGEVTSADSSDCLSGIGGSHASLEPMQPFFVLSAKTVDPVWMVGGPSTTICGFDFPCDYNNNEKGSVVPEFMMQHLKYLNELRVRKGQPNVSIVLLLDGVQTHVTELMLIFFALNNIKLGLRPPKTSAVLQNEDLVTFWQLHNDKVYGFNKLKQKLLIEKITNGHGRSANINFSEVMPLVKKSWDAAHAHDHQARAWFLGGVSPFLRWPQWLLLHREMKGERNAKKRSRAAAEAAYPVDITHEDYLRWGAMLAGTPQPGLKKRCADLGVPLPELTVQEAREVPHKLFSSRMGSSEIFACPKNRRLHLGCFHADVRMISGTKVAEAKELVVQVQTNDPLWGYTFDNKTLKATHQLALVDWAAKYWGFVMVDSALPSDLKAERLRQNPLAVVEDSAEVAAGPPPPPMDMFWRRAKADKLVRLWAQGPPFLHGCTDTGSFGC